MAFQASQGIGEDRRRTADCGRLGAGVYLWWSGSFVAQIKITCANHDTLTVSLAEARQLDAIAIYSKQATGEKYLMNLHQGVGVGVLGSQLPR